jgi:hypothetical protein
LLVHEWGTFTSLQNEAGQAIGGINTDDEPVPDFVHRITDSLLIAPTDVPPIFSKSAPSCHPDVTLRLETPVLYFHLPPRQGRLQGVRVTARFRGGWLSEFYPSAEVESPGITTNSRVFGHLRSDTVGTLVWNDLEVGGDQAGPVTSQHVWTAPRAVQAEAVRTAGGETEKFLFYRGVAHIDAPLAVVQDAHASQLILRSRLPSKLPGDAPLPVRGAWLVDIKANGAVAFRPVPPLALTGGHAEVARVSSHFGPGDYNEANVERLRASLHQGLVAEGLFDDEAHALLDTWKASYFKSAGMRLFFLVPRAWTDLYLPLTVSAESKITRVMVGRIELVTPQQRSYLREIEQISAEDTSAGAKRLLADFNSESITTSQEGLQDVAAGAHLQAHGIPIPRAYQLYLALGRFRNALVLEEAARHPTPGLNALISAYGLFGYEPVEKPAALPAQVRRQ